ncbi:MAG: glutathione S-transferase family protein [Pseudomonadota bacterium]
MRVYGSETSPFARKVRIVIAELGVVDQVEIVMTSGAATDVDPGVRGKAPLRKIPFLETVDGKLVYDSSVICQYLAMSAPGQSLLPLSGWGRIDALTREALADGICDAAVLAVYETRLRPEDKQWQDWVEGQWRKITASLDAMEAATPPSWRFDLGDCAWASALMYLDMRFPLRNWRENRPKLVGWFEGVRTRRSLQSLG